LKIKVNSKRAGLQLSTGVQIGSHPLTGSPKSTCGSLKSWICSSLTYTFSLYPLLDGNLSVMAGSDTV